jgi:hypothetical protein
MHLFQEAHESVAGRANGQPWTSDGSFTERGLAVGCRLTERGFAPGRDGAGRDAAFAVAFARGIVVGE